MTGTRAHLHTFLCGGDKIMSDEQTKPKHESDKDLDRALKDTFPASDPTSGNRIDEKPVRPVHRRPAKIDKALVDKLAKEVERKERAKS
jgi:hypothetical protein